MATAAETFAAAEALLKEGKTQEAADLLNAATVAAKAEADAAAGVQAAPAAPRSIDAVIADILQQVSAHLGHPPMLQTLLTELSSLAPRSRRF